MSKLVWDKIGEREYQTGISNGVVYPQVNGAYPKGAAWNGLTSVSETPSGAEANKIYADNINYLTMISAEELGLTIEAYMYPDEFAKCDGTAMEDGVIIGQQTRQAFGLCYKTIVGNDEKGNDYGYKLHLIYGCKASPSDQQFQTVNDSPEAITFSWSVDTTPVVLSSKDPETQKVYKPTARIILDSTKFADKSKLEAFEAILYGTDASGSGQDVTPGTDARLPLPDDVIAFFRGDSNIVDGD